MDIKVADKVKVISFMQTSSPSAVCEEYENYWNIIGLEGEVMKFDDYDKDRVLVQFQEDIEALKLHCHNEIKNSLWIDTVDLEII